MNESKKLDKQNIKAKKSRLIIRNLSFKATEEDIRNLFSQYGNIVEISLPKKENGQIKGFAFLSFDNMKSSLKAIKFVNGKDVLNRPITVNFSVPKNVYEENKKDKNEDDDLKDEHVENDKNEDDNFEDNYDNNNYQDRNDNFKSQKKKKPDVMEGKTLFIRNLDFETTESSLSNLFTSFGTIEYCKICIDEYSGKSKGTAFVKFKKKEDADKCLEEASIPENLKFYLNGKQLNITLALSRNQLEELKETQSRKHKDKRNLYLAKEGLIYPESPAAVGVSQNDLKKRLALEEKKRKLLQNLHNFISDRRLCVHNLPSNYDDQKLKKLFIAAVNDNSAKILWVKVMRNRSNVDRKFGTSKGFGFVEFNEHKFALKALRFLNNNPDIFTADKRPIVEFSIENKVALNKKKFRELKQQKMKNSNLNTNLNNKNEKNHKTDNKSNVLNKVQKSKNDAIQNYSGVNAKPFNLDEKVVLSKLNRKIQEQTKKLKLRGKKLKQKEKLRQLKTPIKEKNKTKKTKVKKNQNSEPESLVEKLEKGYLKRKSFDYNNDKMNNQSHKKQKWYL